MSETKNLIGFLKRELRRRSITYRDLATHLGQSEANIKRLFNSGRFDLDRLERIAERMNIGLGELFRMYERTRNTTDTLSYEQEEALVKDKRFLLVAICVRSHWTLEEIIQDYEISEPECIRYLVQLDRMQLIELLPGNRIRLCISPHFRWLADGPIEQFFRRHILAEYMTGNFQDKDAYQVYLSGEISRRSEEILQQKLREIGTEFDNLLEEDSHLTKIDKQHVGMMLALRPWEYSVFRRMRRFKS